MRETRQGGRGEQGGKGKTNHQPIGASPRRDSLSRHSGLSGIRRPTDSGLASFARISACPESDGNEPRCSRESIVRAPWNYSRLPYLSESRSKKKRTGTAGPLFHSVQFSTELLNGAPDALAGSGVHPVDLLLEVAVDQCLVVDDVTQRSEDRVRLPGDCGNLAGNGNFIVREPRDCFVGLSLASQRQCPHGHSGKRSATGIGCFAGTTPGARGDAPLRFELVVVRVRRDCFFGLRPARKDSAYG